MAELSVVTGKKGAIPEPSNYQLRALTDSNLYTSVSELRVLLHGGPDLTGANAYDVK